MMLAFAASLLVFGDTGRRAKERVTPDPWELWNSYGEGSSVTYEYEVSGMTVKVTMTLQKKEAEKITLSVAMDIGGTPTDTTQTIEKSNPEKCAECGKPQETHQEYDRGTSTERVTVGAETLECTVLTYRQKGCDGAVIGKWKIWYSRRVPGGMARGEGDQSGMEMRLRCTGFEKK